MDALHDGDALGLDLYVVTGDTSLSDASAEKRIDWKSSALNHWSEQARATQKPLWITETHGAPWPGLTDFTSDDLLYSARRYRATSASVILLRGVEIWLKSPHWRSAGVLARGILGS